CGAARSLSRPAAVRRRLGYDRRRTATAMAIARRSNEPRSGTCAEAEARLRTRQTPVSEAADPQRPSVSAESKTITDLLDARNISRHHAHGHTLPRVRY